MFSNDDALVAALKAHEIDAIEEVPPTAIETLKKAGFTVTDVPGVDQTDFIFNSNPKKKSTASCSNRKVREAFDYAIDRKQIVDVVFLGAAQPGEPRSSRRRPATGPTRTSSRRRSTSPRRTRSSTSSATSAARTGSASRTAQKMSYEVITPTDRLGANRTFEIMQPDFRKIGVQLTQKALDSTRRLRRDHRPERQVRELRPGDVGLGRR